MKYTKQLNIASFSREDYIYIGSFALSSFFQAIVATVQGPSYGTLFQDNSTYTRPSVDITTGTAQILVPPIGDEGNFSATFFGFLLAFYQLFSFILTPIIGLYVEGIGMKKVYLFGIYISGFSPFFSILLNLFPTDGVLYWILSFLLRGAEAVGAVGMQIAIYMMITVLFPGRVASVFALNQAFTVFGVALGGPAIFLIQKIGGFAFPSTVYLTLGVIFIVFVFIVKSLLPDLPARDSLHVTIKELFKRFYHFLKVPSILLFQVSILITGIGNAFLQSILAPNLKELEVGAWGIALIPLLPSLLQLLSPIWGYVLDRIRNGEVVTLIGSVVVVASLFVIGPVPFIPMDEKLWLTCIGLFVFGLGQGAIVVSSYVLLVILAEESNIPNDMITTTIISTSYVAAVSLGSGLSSILSGLFYDNYGFRYATLFPFSLYTFLAILIIIYSSITYLQGGHLPKLDEATETSALLMSQSKDFTEDSRLKKASQKEKPKTFPEK